MKSTKNGHFLGQKEKKKTTKIGPLIRMCGTIECKRGPIPIGNQFSESKEIRNSQQKKLKMSIQGRKRSKILLLYPQDNESLTMECVLTCSSKVIDDLWIAKVSSQFFILIDFELPVAIVINNIFFSRQGFCSVSRNKTV